jgi:hypothetical protein
VQDFSCCKAGGAIVGEDFAGVDRCDFSVQVVFDLLCTTKVNALASERKYDNEGRAGGLGDMLS